jgi:O-antigen biosynthesis protein
MSVRTWPTAVRTLDLSQPLQPIRGVARYARVRFYVSRAARMLGSFEIATDGADYISVARLRDAVAERFAWDFLREDIEKRLGAEADQPLAELPPTVVSIVVPTCDRPDDLRRCLASLVTQVTRHTVEILLVDNRPASGSARAVASEFPGIRVIVEERPGLSFARNAGIAAATGSIIVATDDDVTAPEGWIERLVAPFVRPEVLCVTGNVLPLELETESQCRFEAYGGLGKGFRPFEVDRAWFDSQRTAVPTWILGATANAAFRAAIFRNAHIGLLDEALGAGTPTGCSEDTYLFYKILKSGGTIVYEPSAYVWHRHRSTNDSLRQQIYAYSKGHVAYHLMTLLEEGDRRALVRLLYSLPKTYARRALQRLRGSSDYPLSLILLEARGNLAGPYALWRSRRRVKTFGATAPLACVDAGKNIRPSEPHVLQAQSSRAQDPAA